MTNVLTTGLLTLGMFAGVVLAPPDNAATSEPDWTPVTVFFQSCTPFNECCTGDGCCITGYHTVRGSGDPTTEDTPHPCSNNNSHPCDEHDCEAEEQQDLEALFAMGFGRCRS